MDCFDGDIEDMREGGWEFIVCNRYFYFLIIVCVIKIFKCLLIL